MSRRVQLAAMALAIAVAFPAGAEAATIEPDALTDGIATNNNCTLREAVQAANENIPIDDCEAGSPTEEDRIFLDAGHYKLTIDGDDAQNLIGDLDVDDDDGGALSIRGAGRTATFIDSEMDDRVIEGIGFAEFDLADLTATGNLEPILSGGVIEAAATTLDRVIVESGDAQFGGGIHCSFCTLKVNDSIIRDNQSVVGSTGFPNVIASGGGIHISSGGNGTITDTLVEDNESVANDSQARGGGILAAGTSLKLKRSTITSNTVRSSTNSTSANSVRQGGGIYADNTTKVKITNSTIADNTANSVGKASTGGGVFLTDEANVNIAGTTLSHNSATNGTAVGAIGGTASLAGSILGNTPSGTVCSQTAGGKVKTKGYNVINPAPSGCMDGAAASKDVIDVPNIGSIPIPAGGPTPTLPIPASSPAFNLVPAKRCKVDRKSDQRGAERPAGKRCDAGAYERTKCRGVLVDASFTFLSAGNDNDSGLNGDDFVAPSAGNDRFRSFGGNDILCGGSGKDRLTGDNGNDRLDGGPGTDTCDGGPGNDSAVACENKQST